MTAQTTQTPRDILAWKVRGAYGLTQVEPDYQITAGAQKMPLGLITEEPMIRFIPQRDNPKQIAMIDEVRKVYTERSLGEFIE